MEQEGGGGKKLNAKAQRRKAVIETLRLRVFAFNAIRGVFIYQVL